MIYKGFWREDKKMDKGSFKRVVLFGGLLFCVIIGNVVFMLAWADTVRTQDEEMLGQLILMKPQDEKGYVSVMRGKQAADREAAIRMGRIADEKYGYVGDYAVTSPAVAAFFPVQAFLTVLLTLLLGVLILFQKKRQDQTDLEIFAIRDSLDQALEENKNLKDRMEREEAKTKALVTDVSHQLKTPLASLKMCYEIADTSSFTREEQQTFLAQGLCEVNKLENLIRSLVQVSRLEANMIQIRREKASLKKILHNAVNSVYMKAYDRGISISVNEFEDREVSLDSHWTQEALVNILDNGVKYSEQGTAIEIRVRPMISHYLLEIEDEGIGVEREEANRIFQRFYRGQARQVQETEGSGVGLYLTRKILEAQGGTICVKKGRKGSLFMLTIPLKA